MDNSAYLSTGIESLDREFKGLKPGLMYLITGEEKTGKTSLALQIACIASKKNVETYLLDCGGNLHYLRLSKIASYWRGDLTKIKIAFPHSFKEQEKTIIWIADSVPSGTVVIIDDFTYLHRVHMVGNVALDKRLFHSLSFQLAYLKEACRTRNLTAFIISDVHDVPGESISKPVASAITTYFADTHISLHKVVGELMELKIHTVSSRSEFKVRIHEGGIKEA